MRVTSIEEARYMVEEFSSYSPILEAYISGTKLLEYRPRGGNWQDFFLGDVLNFDLNEYRIKKEPEYIPFTFEDNLLGKVITHNTYRDRAMIHYQMDDGVTVGTRFIGYGELLNEWFFLDSTPCGKQILK